MKVEIETQIEVTMKMNLREARVIERALLENPDTEENVAVWKDIRNGLKKELEKSE